MLCGFCSPLNSIPDIPGIISVVTAGIISMVGIILVAVQMFGYCLEKIGFGHSWNNRTFDFRSACAILNYALYNFALHGNISILTKCPIFLYYAKQKLNIYIF